jgi:hypothetical protein
MYKNLFLMVFAGSCVLSACSEPTAPSPPHVSQAPDAIVAINKTDAPEETSITLSAAGSSDPQGGALTYKWVQTAGTAATISDDTAVETDVAIPEVPADETATFELTVSDGVNTDTATISVNIVNVRDVADSEGKLEIALSTTPVDISEPIYSDDQISQFLITQMDGANATKTRIYTVAINGDGKITEGGFKNPEVSFDQLSPQVRFEDGPEGTALAIEQDSVLVIENSEADRQDGTLKEIARLAGGNVCYTGQRDILSPSPGFSLSGATIIGRKDTGLSEYLWEAAPTTEPFSISHSNISTNVTPAGSCCARSDGYLRGSDPRLGGFYLTALVDVARRLVGLFGTGITYQLQGILIRTAGLPDASIDPNIPFLMSKGNMAVFSDGTIGGKTQLLLMSFQQDTPSTPSIPATDLFASSLGYLRLQVVNYPYGAPADIGLAHPGLNTSASGSNYSFLLTHPDQDKVIQLPVTARPFEIGEPIEIDFGQNATRLVSNAALKFTILTYPNDNRVRIFQPRD